MRNTFLLSLASILITAALATAGCKIRPLDPATGKAIIEEAQPAFDAETFVEENWETRILPTVENEAADLTMLLEALETDEAAASTQYGRREGDRPYNFIVQGTGRVLAADTTSRAGFLLLDVPPLDDMANVRLQIGPVLRGTALRDALPFMTFDRFVNQMEHANASHAMHARLLETVLGELNPASLPGRDIDFHGAFALQGTDLPAITPVRIVIRDSE